MDAMYKTMETTQWKSAADTNKAHAHAVQLIRATQTTQTRDKTTLRSWKQHTARGIFAGNTVTWMWLRTGGEGTPVIAACKTWKSDTEIFIEEKRLLGPSRIKVNCVTTFGASEEGACVQRVRGRNHGSQ